MLATDRKLPLRGGSAKRSYVKTMFTAIAPRYDLLNHLLSLNADRRWRRQAVDAIKWESAPNGRYLDLCAGTLDLAADLAARPGFRGQVIGADFVLPMLVLGRRKSSLPLPINADALDLPFPDRTFDGAAVSFGVRNLANLSAGLTEAARVLKEGARFVILEFTTPAWQPLRGAYLLYFRRLLPLIGKLVSRHGDAYEYLPASVLEFPEPAALAELMRRSGFSDVSYGLLFGGICALHTGTRHAKEPDA